MVLLVNKSKWKLFGEHKNRAKRYDDATRLPQFLNVISNYSTYLLGSDTWNREVLLLGLYLTKSQHPHVRHICQILEDSEHMKKPHLKMSSRQNLSLFSPIMYVHFSLPSFPSHFHLSILFSVFSKPNFKFVYEQQENYYFLQKLIHRKSLFWELFL